MSEKKLFEVRNINKSFFTTKVLKDVSLDFYQGEVHCICGENGAGKSTLIKILSGAYLPDSGTFYSDEQEVTIKEPKDSIALGIQTIYQEHMLFGKLPVYENLFCGQEYTKNHLVDKKAMVNKTREVLDYLNATEISPYDIMGNLSEGNQKTVEIARALIQDAKIIIMDEPTASFSATEIQRLMEIVKQLRKDGICVIYISHHLEEIFQIGDRVTVLRDGEKISTYHIADIEMNTLINDMVGRDVSAFFEREKVHIGDVMLEAKNLSGNGVSDISFEIHEGEILGFAGMVGAGKTEVAELIFGAKKKESGEIYIRGKKVEINSPNDAIANKMCFITESRQYNGLFLAHDIKTNIALTRYSKTPGMLVKDSDDNELAESYVNKLRIVTPTIFKKVQELSGGNQQKVVLSKWFATDGEIYIFDEPTRGVDVGAREEIYKFMTDLIKQGKCILLISSDMPELISLSDRVCVMCRRKLSKTLSGNDINEQTILKYSLRGDISGE